MQSFGYKGKNAAASFVTELLRKKVPANVYNPGELKTRGDTPITDVKQFQTALILYSEITGEPLGGPSTLPPLEFKPVQAFGVSGNGSAVAYANGIWVAVGSNDSDDEPDKNIYISSDHGKTWSAKSAFGIDGQGNAVAWAPSTIHPKGVWVTVGQGDSSMYISTDGGEHWSAKSPFGAGAYGNAVAWAPSTIHPEGVWVATGNGASPNSVLYVSFDGGENWNSKNALTDEGFAVGWGPSTTGNPLGVWVVVGSNLGGDNPDNTIFISTDGGENWHGKSAFGAGGQGNAIAYGDGVWVAVGRGESTIYISTDGGESWTSKSAFNNRGNAIAYGNGLWVAGGFSGDFQNVYSSIDNGDTWIPSLDIPGEVNGVAYGNGQWVAVGNAVLNTIHTSKDGKNWKGQFAFGLVGAGAAVTYGADGVWVAVGEDGSGETAGPNNIFVATT